MKKPLIPAVSFIKALCAMGVVCSHFFTRMVNMDTRNILSFLNGHWGNAVVQTFLVVSGFLLHYHYSDHLELKTYAVKRWRGIFPMFYIAYLYFMFGKVCDNRSIFYYRNPWAYLFTLLGIDGYVMDRLPTYYLVGEWFLGPILIMYILYPLLRKAFAKRAPLSFAAVAMVYVLFYDKPITSTVGIWTLSSCLVSFAFGMLCCRYREVLLGKLGIAAAAVVFITLLTVPMPYGWQNFSEHLMGAALFIGMFAIGSAVMTWRLPEALFRELGMLSYPIFLVHNQIIPRIAGSWLPGNPLKGWALFFMDFAITCCAAKALDVVTRAVLHRTDAWIAAWKARKASV